MPRIEEMYAFVAAESEPDDEGVVASLVNGAWLPFVGSDMDRVESLRAAAQQFATAGNRRVLILRFTDRELIDVIDP